MADKKTKAEESGEQLKDAGLGKTDSEDKEPMEPARLTLPQAVKEFAATLNMKELHAIVTELMLGDQASFEKYLNEYRPPSQPRPEDHAIGSFIKLSQGNPSVPTTSQKAMADKKTKAEESGEQLKDAGLGKTDMLRDSENEEQGAREDPAEEQPRWCRCGKCRPMPTEQENICCSNDDASECFVNSQQFQSLLTPDPLGNNDQVRSNGAYRHEAYRQFTFERHGPLGRGNRRVVPSCVVLAIRSMYPSPEGTYTGFIPSE